MDITGKEESVRSCFESVRERWPARDSAWRTFQMLGLAPTREEITTLAREAGFYDLEMISSDDFLILVRNWKRSVHDEQKLLLEAFHVMDKSGDGLVEPQDFLSTMRTYCSELSEEQLQDLLQEASTRTDGRIDPKDIVDRLMQ